MGLHHLLPSPGYSLLCDLVLLCFLLLKFCSLGFLPCVWTSRAVEIRYLPLQGFSHVGLNLHWSLQVIFPPWTVSHYCFAFGALIFAILEPLALYYCGVHNQGLRRIWIVPAASCHPWNYVTSMGCTPWGYHQVLISCHVLTGIFYLTSGTLWPMPFSRMLALLGLGPQQLLLQGVFLMGCLSPASATRHGHPRACNITTLPPWCFSFCVLCPHIKLCWVFNG